MPFYYEEESPTKPFFNRGDIEARLRTGIVQHREPTKSYLRAAWDQLQAEQNQDWPTVSYLGDHAAALIKPYLDAQLFEVESLDQFKELAEAALAMGTLFDCRTYYREGGRQFEITLASLRDRQALSNLTGLSQGSSLRLRPK